jgi:hypothetical protein
VTDRAKRYRANRRPPPGPRRCNFCASRQNVDIDHVDGDESGDEDFNKIYLCRICNTRKGIVQKRARVGIRTRQYNPNSPTLAGWKHAAAVLVGTFPGDVAEATRYVQGTPAAARLRFSESIAQNNPFRSEAQRRKFFAMVERGEISRAELDRFARHNPAAAGDVPQFKQYAFGVAHHTRGQKDEGGAIIHATPPAIRTKYAERIARLKKQRGTAGGQVPY